MIGTKFRGLTIGLAAFLCGSATAGASSPPASAAAPRPALWKVADEDTEIYLFGTIHLLPQGTKWRTPALEQALGEADMLVIEVLMPKNPAQVAQLMTTLGTSPGLPPLAERVPTEKREALRTVTAGSGLPEQMLDRMESWAAAIVLTSIALVKMGFDPALGVEKQLTGSYEQAQKPVIGLETAEEQLGLFDRLSEEAQRAFLVSAIDDPAAARAQFEAMLRAWLSGDVDEIARSFDDETMLSEELRDVLMRRRNAAWAEWVEQRLQQPGTVFVAVGAGHLAGADSVQRMLEAKRLRAMRVQ